MYDEWVGEMRNRAKRYKRQAQFEAFVFWFTVVLLTVAVVIITGELSGFTSKVLGTF